MCSLKEELNQEFPSPFSFQFNFAIRFAKKKNAFSFYLLCKIVALKHREEETKLLYLLLAL